MMSGGARASAGPARRRFTIQEGTEGDYGTTETHQNTDNQRERQTDDNDVVLPRGRPEEGALRQGRGWSPDLPGGRCRQGRKGIGREALKRRASETIGRKDEAANKTEPLQDLFSLFNFQSEIQPPAAVRHPRARRWEGTIAGNPAQQSRVYHLAKFPAFIILLSYGHKKATFSNLLGRRST